MFLHYRLFCTNIGAESNRLREGARRASAWDARTTAMATQVRDRNVALKSILDNIDEQAPMGKQESHAIVSLANYLERPKGDVPSKEDCPSNKISTFTLPQFTDDAPEERRAGDEALDEVIEGGMRLTNDPVQIEFISTYYGIIDERLTCPSGPLPVPPEHDNPSNQSVQTSDVAPMVLTKRNQANPTPVRATRQSYEIMSDPNVVQQRDREAIVAQHDYVPSAHLADPAPSEVVHVSTVREDMSEESEEMSGEALFIGDDSDDSSIETRGSSNSSDDDTDADDTDDDGQSKASTGQSTDASQHPTHHFIGVSKGDRLVLLDGHVAAGERRPDKSRVVMVENQTRQNRRGLVPRGLLDLNFTQAPLYTTNQASLPATAKEQPRTEVLSGFVDPLPSTNFGAAVREANSNVRARVESDTGIRVRDRKSTSETGGECFGSKYPLTYSNLPVLPGKISDPGALYSAMYIYGEELIQEVYHKAGQEEQDFLMFGGDNQPFREYHNHLDSKRRVLVKALAQAKAASVANPQKSELQERVDKIEVELRELGGRRLFMLEDLHSEFEASFIVEAGRCSGVRELCTCSCETAHTHTHTHCHSTLQVARAVWKINAKLGLEDMIRAYGFDQTVVEKIMSCKTGYWEINQIIFQAMTTAFWAETCYFSGAIELELGRDLEQLSPKLAPTSIGTDARQYAQLLISQSESYELVHRAVVGHAGTALRMEKGKQDMVLLKSARRSAWMMSLMSGQNKYYEDHARNMRQYLAAPLDVQMWLDANPSARYMFKDHKTGETKMGGYKFFDELLEEQGVSGNKSSRRRDYSEEGLIKRSQTQEYNIESTRIVKEEVLQSDEHDVYEGGKLARHLAGANGQMVAFFRAYLRARLFPDVKAEVVISTARDPAITEAELTQGKVCLAELAAKKQQNSGGAAVAEGSLATTQQDVDTEMTKLTSRLAVLESELAAGKAAATRRANTSAAVKEGPRAVMAASRRSINPEFLPPNFITIQKERALDILESKTLNRSIGGRCVTHVCHKMRCTWTYLITPYTYTSFNGRRAGKKTNYLAVTAVIERKPPKPGQKKATKKQEQVAVFFNEVGSSRGPGKLPYWTNMSHTKSDMRHADRLLFGWHLGASRWQYGSGDLPRPLTTLNNFRALFHPRTDFPLIPSAD